MRVVTVAVHCRARTIISPRDSHCYYGETTTAIRFVNGYHVTLCHHWRRRDSMLTRESDKETAMFMLYRKS